MSCWRQSISKVAPVTAVLVMRWMADASMFAGLATRRGAQHPIHD
jgi:hypothetical protein